MASHIISGTTSMVLLLTFVLIAPRGMGSRRRRAAILRPCSDGR